MKSSKILRATSNPGIIQPATADLNFASRPRQARPPKNPLLSPVPLYRLILRSHRALPKEFRAIGDPYVKSEFRLHKDTDNPIHIVGFLSEWQKYAQDLKGPDWLGDKIDKTKIDKMSDEQLGQLYELFQATKEASETKEAQDLIDRITNKDKS